jgi:ADP-heptose:LPS heptosyltransferase
MHPAADLIARLSPDEREALAHALAVLRSEPGLQRPRLLVYGLGSFGDALQLTPLVHCLRRRFAQAELTLIHHHPLARSLLEGHRDVDRLIALPSRAHEAMRGLVRAEALADLMVECRYVIRYELVSGRSFLTPKQREFVESAQAGQQEWLPFVRRFPFDNDELWRAAAARGWSMPRLMANTAGFADDDFEALRLTLSDEDFAVRRKLPRHYLTVCNSAETLSITQGPWTKVLARDKMARIVKGLKAFSLPIVLLGARDDARIDEVDIDLRGGTSIREAAAVLQHAAAFVGPEGGLANVARAVQTRSVVFFGSTPPEFFAFRANINVLPLRCGGCWWTTPSYLHQCPRLQVNPECTESIPEHAVVRAVGEILE